MPYRGLQYDKSADAAAPYSRTLPAFLLIEGWHVRYLLILIGVGLLGSFCVVAVARYAGPLA
jgi:hypothetical protein